jgi:putative aldouronate transport system permease protein
VKKLNKSRKVFLVINYIILIASALVCLLPLINVLAMSFSSTAAVQANMVQLWPVDFNLESYKYVIDNPRFTKSFLVSLQRVALGIPINTLFLVLVAYPLSKSPNKFHGRGVYVAIIVVAMLFNGGTVPTYMAVKNYGLLDNIWALILPGALPIFNVIILLNFFRMLPEELEEAAFIDGAGFLTTLFKIILPLSLPSLATVTLFSLVGHWNSYFDGLIYMKDTAKYPLQTYLQTLIVQVDLTTITNSEQAENLAKISDRTAKSAQIFIATLPILAIYPFLQKYFTTGLTLGSVKG